MFFVKNFRRVFWMDLLKKQGFSFSTTCDKTSHSSLLRRQRFLYMINAEDLVNPFEFFKEVFVCPLCWIRPVSYTHLDVYKRQYDHRAFGPAARRRTDASFAAHLRKPFFMRRRLFAVQIQNHQDIACVDSLVRADMNDHFRPFPPPAAQKYYYIIISNFRLFFKPFGLK